MFLDENQAYGFKLCEKSKEPPSEWSACLHHRFFNVVERLGGKKDENQAYGVTLCDKSKQPQFEWSVCFHHRFLNVVERLGGKKGPSSSAARNEGKDNGPLNLTLSIRPPSCRRSDGFRQNA
nr:transcription activator GLK2-like isoform X1 [Ipomoea batatas]